MFGFGMVLARGMSGLLLTFVAQASLSGVLSPLRLEISSWWPIAGGVRDLPGGSPQWLGVVIGLF